MKPLIVMGMGRSGTRFFSDVMSRHESILLYGEIPHSATSLFFKTLDTLDSEHDRNDSRRERWFNKKKDFIFDAFGYMAMGSMLERGRAIYCGHKTPRSEIHFDKYEHHFKTVGDEPYYFYCIRNPVDVWASYKSMPWNSFPSVKDFLAAYERSITMYERAKKKATNRVFMLNLDEYINAENKEGFIEKKILSPLGLSCDKEYFDRVFSIENTNSSQSKTGSGPRKISEDERREIMASTVIREVMRKYF